MKSLNLSAFVGLLFLGAVNGCKTQHELLSSKSYSIGTYENASKDTSIYGYYLNGRATSGLILELNEDHTYTHQWYCDVCPIHKTLGTFIRSGDTIF